MLQLSKSSLAAAIRSAPAMRAFGRIESVRGTIETSLAAGIGDLCEIRCQHGGRCLAEVISFHGRRTQIMPFGASDSLRPGDEVIGLGRALHVPVGPETLGRVVNVIGEPIDDQGPLGARHFVPVQGDPPATLMRSDIAEVLVTGQKAIDGLLTIGRGQRIGIFGGSGVGKSTLLGQIACHAQADLNVVAMVGERSREVAPFIRHVLGPAGMKKSVVVVSTSNESPLARVRATESALAMADWFRRQGKSVLMILDSITRFAMAQRDLGLMLGEPPTSRGYTPSVFHKLAVVLERMGKSDCGSVTGIITVLVEGDDLNDPIADSVRAILDGHIVLSRKMANAGSFPAIDILHSNSRLFLDLTGPQHQQAALAVRQILARYDEVSDLLQIGAYQKGVTAATDLAIELYPMVRQFLQQELNQPTPWNGTLRDLNAISHRWTGMHP